MGAHPQKQLWYGQLIRRRGGHLPDHVRGPGAHHLGSQHHLGVGFCNDFDEAPLLPGYLGFPIGGHQEFPH